MFWFLKTHLQALTHMLISVNHYAYDLIRYLICPNQVGMGQTHFCYLFGSYKYHLIKYMSA